MGPNQIYKLKLHESVIVFNEKGHQITALRVPGGWLYQYRTDTRYEVDYAVFVPFNNEFQKSNIGLNSF